MSETGEHASMLDNMHRHGIRYRDQDIVHTIAEEYIAQCGSVDGWVEHGSCSEEDRRLIADMLDEIGRDELVDDVCAAILSAVRSDYEDDLETARSVYVASRASMTIEEACRVIARHRELPTDHWLRSARLAEIAKEVD